MPAYEFDGNGVAARLTELLNEAMASAGTGQRFSAKFEAPAETAEQLVSEVRECHSRNCTLTAKIRLSFGSGSGSGEIEIPVLFPYHGVFVMGCNGGGFNRPVRARLMVWRPCLVRRPGLWLLREYASGGKPEWPVELGLLPGEAVSTNAKVKPSEFKVLVPQTAIRVNLDAIKVVIGDGAYEEALGQLAGRSNLLWDKAGCCEALRIIREALKRKRKKVPSELLFDDEDLKTKRLFTYGVFLAENLAQLVCKKMLTEEGIFDGARLDSRDGAAFGVSIRSRMKSRGGYRWMHPFEPRNAAEAASCLTAFARYGLGGESLEKLPARDRQNHPSFEGYVCPVQTPESELVGLTLNLAAGVTADCEGVMSPGRETGGLGYAASLLPFYQHTDAARAMMGAKNYVQALTVEGAEPPLVATGAETAVRKALAPLADAGLLPKDDAFYAPGRNLIVAYMPWYGLNYNDAIVANADLAGPLSYSREERGAEYLEPGESLAEFENCDPVSLLGKAGSQVDDGDTIAKVSGRRGRRCIRCGQRGQLVEVKFHPPAKGSGCGGLIEWSVETCHSLGVGDKLMGRHGNKGVISAMLPPEMMPRLPEDERLGELSGKGVDLVLNPLGVISRMNVGQLIETHVGLLNRLGVRGVPEDCGKPFAAVNAELMRGLLLGVNGDGPELVDGMGRMLLKMPPHKGEDVSLGSPVVAGIQYFVRLDHIPAEKAHYRGKGCFPRDYDPVTGQATQGKGRRGGQRIGEMEMWALAAYGADRLLKRMCTDAYRPRGIPETEPESQTFRAIRDMLFAIGVVLDSDSNGGGYRMRWACADDFTRKGREVMYTPGTPAVRKAAAGEFAGPSCGCKLRGVSGSSVSADGEEYRVSVEDLFRDKGVILAACDCRHTDLIFRKEGRVLVYTAELCLDDRSKPVTVTLSKGKRPKEKNEHLDIVIGGDSYHAYKPHGVKTLSEFLGMELCCGEYGRNHSTTKPFACSRPDRLTTVNAWGGLADPRVFENETSDWGFIRLNEPVTIAKPPAHADSGNAQSKWAHMWPAFTVLPVLPWRYRRGYRLEDGTEIPNPLTELYEEIAGAVQKATDNRDNDEAAAKKRNDEAAKKVKKLFWRIKRELEGKYGLLRRQGLGRRVDCSGRLVVVPDPELNWDECGLPLKTLLEMFAHDKDMVSMAAGPEPEAAVTEYLKLKECLVLVNRYPTLHRYNIKALKPVVMRCPGRSRADAQMSGGAEPDPPHVMSVNPLVCLSMGCDHDGDEISFHSVLSEDERAEAGRLLPTASGNLLSLADGSPVAGLDQDMVLGTYLISMDTGLRSEFAASVLVEGCGGCLELAKKALWDNGACQDILKHMCVQHKTGLAKRVGDWMRMAFAAVTRKGVSFGYFDLLGCRPEGVGDMAKKFKCEIAATETGKKKSEACESLNEACENRNEELFKTVNGRLSDILGTGKIRTPGFSVAAMALSGARGDKQVRQVVGARGFLDPGASCFEADPGDFFFRESLAEGMGDPSSSFRAAMNGRSTMTDKKLATGKAGHLTRKMVMACWPWRVREGDCGSEAAGRSPATCGWASEKRICAICYGTLPDGTEPPDGYPAGLVAAQSIGERGTQLSMKGFHTGTKAVDADGVLGWMKCDDFFDPAKGPQEFIGKFRGETAYQKIDERHFQLLWRVISMSNGKKLGDAIAGERRGDLFTGLAGTEQVKHIFERLKDGAEVMTKAESAVSRIMIGFPGGVSEPETTRRRDGVVDATERLANVLGHGGDGAGDGLGPQEETGEGGEEEAEAEGEVPEGATEESASNVADCDVETGDDDENQERRVNTAVFSAPPDSAVVALVVCERGGVFRCRVEMPARSLKNSSLAVLAQCCADWLAKKHPGLLSDRTDVPKFTSCAEILKQMASDGLGAESSKMEPGDFVRRTCLYWQDACLPLKALVNAHDLKPAPLAEASSSFQINI